MYKSLHGGTILLINCGLLALLTPSCSLRQTSERTDQELEPWFVILDNEVFIAFPSKSTLPPAGGEPSSACLVPQDARWIAVDEFGQFCQSHMVRGRSFVYIRRVNDNQEQVERIGRALLARGILCTREAQSLAAQAKAGDDARSLIAQLPGRQS